MLYLKIKNMYIENIDNGMFTSMSMTASCMFYYLEQNNRHSLVLIICTMCENYTMVSKDRFSQLQTMYQT